MRIRDERIDALAGEQDILVFDCEFWRKGTVMYPREIGGFRLKKVGGQWSGTPFFVVLAPPPGKVSYISSYFSRVQPKTAELLDIIQDTEMFAHEHAVQNEGVAIYLADPIIKKHRVPASWLRGFMETMKSSLVIVKGDTDFDALKNACALHKIPYTKPTHIDISTWNSWFTRKCGSAKLEDSFNCIKKKIGGLANLLPLTRAHDPVTDAAMAFAVAVAMKDVR